MLTRELEDRVEDDGKAIQKCKQTTRHETTHLPNRNRPPLVPRREPAELGVVCETLDAHGLGGLDKGDYFLARSSGLVGE